VLSAHPVAFPTWFDEFVKARSVRESVVNLQSTRPPAAFALEEERQRSVTPWPDRAVPREGAGREDRAIHGEGATRVSKPDLLGS